VTGAVVFHVVQPLNQNLLPLRHRKPEVLLGAPSPHDDVTALVSFLQERVEIESVLYCGGGGDPDVRLHFPGYAAADKKSSEAKDVLEWWNQFAALQTNYLMVDVYREPSAILAAARVDPYAGADRAWAWNAWNRFYFEGDPKYIAEIKRVLVGK
jgi:hypothetical protein